MSIFQSTLPYGSDLMVLMVLVLIITFQSTLPYGSDSRIIAKFSTNANFNPRSLTGATVEWYERSDDYPISIHAPLRERPSIS